MNNVNKKLTELSAGYISNWSKEADFRIKNKIWLRYSSNIARRILAAIEEKEGMNQKMLAKEIGVTAQYISKVIKGQENLTLETIAKLSTALNVDLISFPEYKYSAHINLNDSSGKTDTPQYQSLPDTSHSFLLNEDGEQ